MIHRLVLSGLCAVLAASGWGEIKDARRDAAARQGAALIAKMTPQERLAELMMFAPGVPRLGISPYHWWNEALHGIAREGLATVFPQSMAAAATFDAALVAEVGDIVSTEARAKYNLFSAKGDHGIYRGLTVWSPNVNMFRDPRWGRGQETFGEDPLLASVLGGAYTRGLQGDDPKYLKTAACAKHFAVHSGPEKLRHGFNAKVSARDLNEYYLPAFESLVREAKVESVMGAYSALNGTPCCANTWLLTDLLRGAWGFRGHVVSDVGAIGDIHTGHRVVPSDAAASVAAMKAGVDLCSEGTYRSLEPGVATGGVTAAEMEIPLRRLYTTRALLGQFDPKGSTPWDSLGAESVATKEHRAVALRMAEKSLVLVSNRNGALPVDPARIDGVGVVGPLATSEVALLGNYCGYTDSPVSCLSGFVGEGGPALRVMAEPEILSCDLIVACVGITADDEGEEGCSLNNAGADRASYGLPPSHLECLRKYRARFPKTKLVAVVFGCSPFDLKPVADICDAVLVAWYPGEQGGRAIARTVFGRNNPAGRLPITYPKSYADLPAFEDYSLAGRTYRYATKEPLYPFGYGLSYTTFAYGKAKSTVEGEGEGRNVRISVDVTNTGKVTGDEVVQAYVRAPEGAGDRRRHHLEGFARVNLAPGETKSVTLTIPYRAFRVFDETGRGEIPAGRSTVFVGGGQPGFADTVSATVDHSECDFQIRDPFVLVENGRYYLYESRAWRGGEGVYLRTSTDLENWTPKKLVMKVPDGVEFTAVWAPEVHHFNGRYYLFTTLTEKKGTYPIKPMGEGVEAKNLEPRGTWAFVADRPEGPFRPVKTGPVPGRDLMTLDGTLFVEDGRPYLVYCHEWCQVRNGLVEYAPLTDDLGSFATAPTRFFDAEGAMAGAHNVTDGPFFWRSEKSTTLYMIWSNTIEKHGYCVLVRASPSGRLAGPWTKDEILFGEDGGHGMIFKDLKGRLLLTLHQPNESPRERMRLFELEDDGKTLRLKR